MPLAPTIRSIPPEIIREIFIFCVLYPLKIPMPSPLLISAPWNLLLVCSKWRQLALETSALWNDIYIYFDASSDFPWQTLKLALSRTGTSLLSLQVRVSYHLSGYLQRKQTALRRHIGDLIQPFAGQFKHLSLDAADDFRCILDIPRGMMDALQSVYLSFSDERHKYTLKDSNSFHPSLYPVTAFDNARNLREFTLITEFATLHPQYFRLPWERLTQLHLINTPIPFVEGHEALSQCINLVAATLTIPSDERCLHSSSITLLPHLSSLAIRTATESATLCFGRFLKPFVLPSLKQFEIITLSNSLAPELDDTWSQSNLLSLMKRSSCSLERFKAAWITPQLLHAFLKAVPSLVELSFPWVRPEPLAIFQMIFQEIRDGLLVPNLRILECNMNILDDVLNMVEARTNQMDHHSPCTIINSVIIQGHPRDLDVIPRSVGELRVRGISIVFLYAGGVVDG
jgi:F-box-like